MTHYRDLDRPVGGVSPGIRRVDASEGYDPTKLLRKRYQPRRRLTSSTKPMPFFFWAGASMVAPVSARTLCMAASGLHSTSTIAAARGRCRNTLKAEVSERVMDVGPWLNG